MEHPPCRLFAKLPEAALHSEQDAGILTSTSILRIYKFLRVYLPLMIAYWVAFVRKTPVLLTRLLNTSLRSSSITEPNKPARTTRISPKRTRPTSLPGRSSPQALYREAEQDQRQQLRVRRCVCAMQLEEDDQVVILEQGQRSTSRH